MPDPGRARRLARASPATAPGGESRERAGPLKEAFETLAGAERSRIHAELPEARKLAAELQGQYAGHLYFQIKHPEALRRVERLDQEIASAAWEMDVGRQDLDGIPPRLPECPSPAEDSTERRPCWSGASGWSYEPLRGKPSAQGRWAISMVSRDARRLKANPYGRRLRRRPGPRLLWLWWREAEEQCRAAAGMLYNEALGRLRF